MAPVSGAAEDGYVKSWSPGYNTAGYEFVVGKHVTFDWTTHWNNPNPQRTFELVTSASDQSVKLRSSETKYTYEYFPFGTGFWEVTAWRDCLLCKNDGVFKGRTSRKNFFHYNNVSNTTNYRPEPFEYRRGARSPNGNDDLTIFFELTKDYRINLNSYFAQEKALYPSETGFGWKRLDSQIDILREHVKEAGPVESDFIKLDNGVLTLKKGFRWDGTSNPFVWEENPTDLRSSCVHDAIYDLMRMGYLRPDYSHLATYWIDLGYQNRLMADMMHYWIAIEDRDKTRFSALEDFGILRFGGQGKTHKPDLLKPFKFHVSELTAWVSENGSVDLHWRPANLSGKDPKNYHTLSHNYDIFRTTSNASAWSYIGNAQIDHADVAAHTKTSTYFTDSNVVDEEIYYYWIRANDYDNDGDGWTDQEEDDYGGGYNNRPGLHPWYYEKHYDQSGVEAVIPIIGPGNALQLNGVDQYVISTSERGAVYDDSWTFEAWVHPEGEGTIFHASDLDRSPHNRLVYSRSTEQFCYSTLSLADPDQVSHCTEEGVATPNHWYHLALTMQEGEIVLYVDGLPEATITASQFQPPETVPTFSIGAVSNVIKEWDETAGEYGTGLFIYRNIASSFFKGKIDELRVWDIALNKEEIQENMYMSLGGDFENLVALWHFDEPDRTHTAHDATVNGRDGEVHECTAPNSSCFVQSKAMNMSPIAQCSDMTVVTEREVPYADASIDAGSYDPDYEDISLFQEPEGPYELGETSVTLRVVDEWGNDNSCMAVVTVFAYGDLNRDGIIDRSDINIIKTYRNQQASSCPECDLDHDGTITVLDARQLMMMCTNSRCATN